MASAPVRFVDVTVRDGQQSLWATRMTTAMMLGIASALDRAGFDAIEILGPVHFDACVRYLKENPWERLRLLRQHLRRTPLQSQVRSRNFLSFSIMPDDVMELVYTRLHANGVDRLCPFDGLHDLDNLRFGIGVCKRLGAHVCVPLVFSLSPVHTDEYYARKARDVLQFGADRIMLKDPAGLLTVDRIRTLAPALRRAVGDRPLELHTHCLTGLGPLVTLEGLQLGVDAVHTALPPLADGASLPSVFNVAENLRTMGYEVAVDLEPLGEASRFLTAVACKEGLPRGEVAHYDLFHYKHQVPGGMIANLRRQLADAGMADKLRTVLEEIPRVRAELGWPVMVSPFSQLVGIQALLNVVQGERYRTVLDEIAKWAYGYYGTLEAPVAPDVMDRIAEQCAKRISPTPEPPAPLLPGLRSAFPAADDDELVLRAFFKGTQVDEMLAAQPMDILYEFQRDVVGLVRRLTAAADNGRVVLSTAGLEVAWQR